MPQSFSIGGAWQAIRQLFVNDKRAADQVNCIGPQPPCGYPPGSGGGLTNCRTGMSTDRDQLSYSFYAFPRIFSQFELENAFRSSWVAKRIVTLPPNDMTREWRGFHIGGDDDGSLVRGLEASEKQLQLRKHCNLAMKWARLYGGAVIMLGMRGQNPSEPLDEQLVRQGDLEYLLVIDRFHIGFGSEDYIFDIGNPMFGAPQFYEVLGSGVQWHNSRVIRFDGEELPLQVWQMNMRWGDSVLQHVLNVVMNLEASQHASLLAMQQGSLDILSLPNMRQMLAMSGNGMQQIRNRVQFFSDLKSIYRTAVKDADEKFDRIAASLGGYDQLFSRFQDEVCGAAAIPHTVLYGQSPAGLQSTGAYDTRQYYDHISSLQENMLRPQLDYLDQIFVRSALGFWPADYSYDFHPLWQIDRDVESQILLRNAQRDQIYVEAGVLEPEMVSRQLLNDGTYSTLTGDDVNLIESFNLPPASPPRPAVPAPMPEIPEGATASHRAVSPSGTPAGEPDPGTLSRETRRELRREEAEDPYVDPYSVN